MVYRNARLIDMRNGKRPAIVFDSPNPKHPNEITYGGKLAENVVSAICRDLLVAAIVECERQNLPVAMHVHDEIVLEVPAERADESLQQLLLIMSTPPAWAAGFPIEVEGFYAERYYKSPPAGSRSIRARQGLILPPE
jgi:DNA polymerase